MTGPGAAEPAFDAIAERLRAEPAVSGGTGFGQMPGLRVGGRIFAMLVDGRLVVKLPAARCVELTESGAESFTIGRRRMREWVSIAADAGEDWDALADEALAFVRP